MSTPHALAACRRILGVSIAIAVAMLAWGGGASVARAGCGDDLMPLHPADSAGDAAEPHSTSGTVADSLATRFPNRPCDGPGCGETPADLPGLAAVPQPHRGSTGAMALAGAVASAMPPMIIDRIAVESKGTPTFEPVAVFRPPSASPLR